MAHNISSNSTSQPNNDIPANNQGSNVAFTFGRNTTLPSISSIRRHQQRAQHLKAELDFVQSELNGFFRILLKDLEEFSQSKSLALVPLKEKFEVTTISRSFDFLPPTYILYLGRKNSCNRTIKFTQGKIIVHFLRRTT